MSKKNKLLEYLEPVLSSGTEVDIAAARKQYRRNQQAQWVKVKRQKNRHFLIYFSHQQLQIIARAAKAHNRSKTKYISEAALAYAEQIFLVPDRTSIYTIQSLLAANYNALQVVIEQTMLPQQIGTMLSSILTDLEAQIVSHLEHPKQIASDC